MNRPVAPKLDHELRHRRITSSRAAAVLGLDPFRTPLRVWAEITGNADVLGAADDAQDDDDEEEEDEDALDDDVMERGKILEPVILEYPARKWGWTVVRPPTVPHPRLPWAADSCDAIYMHMREAVALGEAKSVNARMIDRWGEPGTDQVPDNVAIQCHWHLMHHEPSRCMVPILGGFDLKFRVYEVRRDPEVIDALEETIGQWYRDHVVANEAPAPTVDDARLFDRLNMGRKMTMLTDDLALEAIGELALDALELNRTRKRLKDELAEVRMKMRQIMVDHDKARGDGWSCSYLESAGRTSIDTKRMIEDLGEDVVAKYTRVSRPSRILRVNRCKTKAEKELARKAKKGEF